MIELNTDCAKCSHERVCQYKYNARSAMNKLKDMTYGNGPNDDYDWDTMMQHKHVDIKFSCRDFERKPECGIR